MPDYEREWERLQNTDRRGLIRPGIAIRNVVGLAQYVVSGNLKAVAQRVGVDAEGAGALGLTSGSRYSVRLARDRLLIVSNEDRLLEHGYYADGYGVTGMSAALEVLEISGTLSLEIVKRATALFHAAPSPCAATSFAGVTAYVYRFGDEQNVRIHLDRGLAPYLWDWLGEASQDHQ
jgi:sarcosine oxidase gamma subunit